MSTHLEMTSQKRFRHQEHSHSNNRNRDIPPRFKRQKSSSGQPSVEERPVSPLSLQSDKSNLTNNMTRQSQIPTPTATMNKESPPQYASSGRARYSVLQPVNYMYTEIPSNQIVPAQQVYPMVPSSQMWAPAAYTGMQPVMVSHNSMLLPQTVPQVTSYINENSAPSPSLYMAQCSPMSPWNTSAYSSPYPSSCSSPAPSVPSPSPSGLEPEQEKSQQLGHGKKNQAAKYTDPDLRTIEMLRELERVADKEIQEAEETGSDRKTLVSHHLRMLMCAMDRYTEDIDDEIDSRDDGGISANSSGYSSPSTSPVPLPGKQQESLAKGKIENMSAQAWNQKHAPQAQLQRPRPVLGNSSAVYPVPQRSQASYNSTSGQHRLNQVPRTPWAQNPQAMQQSEWNLWSSPSFNFYGALGHPLDSPNEHFENLQDACFPASKERKPLYKR